MSEQYKVQTGSWRTLFDTRSEGFPLDKLQDFMNHGDDKRG